MINSIANQQTPGKHARSCPAEVIHATSIDTSPAIVLAEDDNIMRQAVALALTNRGFNVCCAADGVEAWKLLCKSFFSIFITDNDMPGLNGIDVLRRMRASSFSQPAILMSGNIPWNEPDLRELLSPGMTIQKPFGVDQLISAMSALDVLQPNDGRENPYMYSLAGWMGEV